MENRRLMSLDTLRGIAVIFILFFHSSIFNYANIHKIDFSNPPILIILMSFMALWGGLFIIYSTVVNTLMLLRRNQEAYKPKAFLYPVIAGAVYILFHFILNIFLGRWNTDFVNNLPDLTVVAGSLRNLTLTLPHVTKFFEGSSLSTIAANLMALSLIFFFMLRNNGILKEKRNYLILGISGSLIMLFSFVRVDIYPLFTKAIENNSYLASLFFSFTLANPYPLLPYLAYGIIGMMIGMMIYHGRDRLLKLVAVPMGLIFFVFGFIGMMNLEKSISKPDYFWYFKTNFELGVFILMLVFSLLVLEPRSRFLNRVPLLRWFSRVSLTIYMLETTTSEILRKVGLSLFPSWNQTINGCLLFGCVNILLWMIILYFWKKANFKYSLEYFWVRFFGRLGKASTKMDGTVSTDSRV
jgi:surface polysaccharide O-acyltransferase-like enzyme